MHETQKWMSIKILTAVKYALNNNVRVYFYK